MNIKLQQNGAIIQNGTSSSIEYESKENDSQSQDLFPQSPALKTPQISTQDIIFSKPTLGGNPFLKKSTESQVKKNPLGLTDITSCYENLPSTSKKDDVVIEKKAGVNKKISSSPAPEETFVGWFSKEKTNLAVENPDLSPAELTQVALKMFKSNKEKRKATDDDGGKRKQPKLSAFAFSKNK